MSARIAFPEQIKAPWIESLSNDDLLSAEATLRASLAKEEKAERKRRGALYDVMRGPESLTNAWNRWSMVSAAARERGLRVRYRN